MAQIDPDTTITNLRCPGCGESVHKKVKDIIRVHGIETLICNYCGATVWLDKQPMQATSTAAKQTLTAGDICSKASALVSGDRAVTHGDKSINFQNTADMWNAILRAKSREVGCQGGVNVTLDALDVANMLEAFKIARRYSGSHNVDDYVDGAGYAGCAGEIAEKQQ